MTQSEAFLSVTRLDLLFGPDANSVEQSRLIESDPVGLTFCHPPAGESCGKRRIEGQGNSAGVGLLFAADRLP